MVYDVLELIAEVFTACADWTNRLFSAVNGGGVVLVAFCIYLVINLLFVPLRGGTLLASWDTVRDFNAGVIHKGKYSGSGWTLGSRSAKGKFSADNKPAQWARRGKHTRYYAGGSGKQGI